MHIHPETLDQLDIPFVVQRLNTHSPYGEELRRNLPIHGLGEDAVLEEKYDQLEAAMEIVGKKKDAIAAIQSILCDFNQLRGTASRIRKGTRLSVLEFHELKTFAIGVQKLIKALESVYWQEQVGVFVPRSLEEVVRLLDPNDEGTQTFHIYSKYSEGLAQIRKDIELAQKEYVRVSGGILKELEAEGYSVVQGVVRVRKNEAAKADADPRLVLRSESPTMRSYHVLEAKEVEDRIERLKEAEDEEETRIRGVLTEALKAHIDAIEYAFDCIGNVDLCIAKAQFSIGHELTRPVIGLGVRLQGAFHLRVKHSLALQGKRFTPIDVDLKTGVSIITGANMGGKTVSIKLIGQCVLLAHMGFFVPARHAEIELYDRIFMSVGDDQNVDLGLSTFGSEMTKLIELLGTPFARAMVLLDELARGTNPDEGAAISRALVEHLLERKVRAVITTHFDGLTLVPGTTHYQVVGLANADLAQIKREGGQLRLHEYMDYRLEEALPNREIPKEAIRISEMLGLSENIVSRARDILGG